MSFKRILGLSFFLFYFQFVFAFDSEAVLKGAAAQREVPGASIVRVSEDGKIPSFIKFQKGQEMTQSRFMAWFQRYYDLNPDMGMELINTYKDQLGYTHKRFKQTYKDVPLREGVIILHLDQSGKVYAVNGNPFASVQASAQGNLSKDVARQKALEHVGAELYKWEVASEEEWIKAFKNDPNASYFPEGKKIYSMKGEDEGASLKLAYMFNIYAEEPLSRSEVMVNASNGAVLFENDLIHAADDTGTAVTGYSGTRQIVVDSTASNYRLRETGRGNGIETYDMNEGTDYTNAVDFTDGDNYWNNANADLDEYATDAHWGAERTYDYFLQKHNRNSIDDNGFALLSYLHYDQNYGNAFWDGQRMTYGDGSSGNPFTALDITGHEITHGLTSNTANLDYSYESGALNESFSDIFGESIEYFSKPSNFNWEVGEDIGGIRDMANPHSYSDPHTYQGTYWYSGTNDNGGVHTNSGVQNYWYYLLVTGGSGTNDLGDSYSVSSIGWDDAASIAYRNLVVYLTNTSEYDDARFYAIQSAVDLFGNCSPEVQATTNAWYAVGVGPEYQTGVHSDFSADITEDCDAPLTVAFSNSSINGTSFEWDFGDGNTSTSLQPSHTYSSSGTYDVTLIADGGSCGADTLTKTAYIDIDASNPCFVVMPNSGTGSVQKGCQGFLYDSGGPNDNYPDQRDSYITISPSGASQVTLDFLSFDVEPGSGATCDYDYVEIFDGYSTAATSLGKFCNTNGSPGSITSSDSALTIHLHSDQAVNHAGFEAEWQCTLPNSAPETDFVVSDTVVCSGQVSFTDESLHAPTSWNWDFGDGNTSTAQNPTHTYSSSGVYSVELVATNSNGSDSIIRTNYIEVNLPTLPSVADTTICGNGPVDLTANGSGDFKWYDTAVGGSWIDTGSVFTTSTITDSAVYYVENVIGESIYNVGPLDNNIGTGSNFTYDQHLIFDCNKQVTLESVLVYAQGAKNRTIELRDNAGTVLQDTTINIPDGAQRIPLNFDLPIANDLQLGVSGTGADLYRNDSGSNYPYTIPNVLSITGSSASSAGYYYFFYDWIVKEEGCTSVRDEVKVFSEPDLDATISGPSSLCQSASPTGLTGVDTGGVWSGTGIIDANAGTFDPGTAGAGTHTVYYELSGNCGDMDSLDILVKDSMDAMITAPGSFCEDDSSTFLNAADPGGVWTGNGVMDSTSGEFDPTVAGVGTHAITYRIDGTCGDTNTISLTVYASPDASILTQEDTLCSADAPVSLSAATSGGAWSGTGVDSAEFDPSSAGTGVHSIYYSVSNTNGCSSSDSINMAVDICSGIERSGKEDVSLKVYPDPTDGKVFIEINSANGIDQGKLILMDAVGRKVHYQEIRQSGTKLRQEVDLSRKSRGIYLIRFVDDNQAIQKKLIVN